MVNKMRNKICLISLILLSFFLLGCTSNYGDASEAYNSGKRDGYSLGYEDGYQEGYEAGPLELDDAIEYLESKDYYCLDEDEYRAYGYMCGYCAGYSLWCNWKDYDLNDSNFGAGYEEGFYEGFYDQWYENMEVSLINVSPISDAISGIGFNLDDDILYIKWQQGNLYEYYDVSWDIFWDLLSADSLGSFANENIKGVYEYSKIG